MRNLIIILFSLVLFVCLSFAQNTSTLTQTGDLNHAVVDQTTNNTATISQTSGTGLRYGPPVKYNEVYLTQIGTNTASITQDMVGQGFNDQYYFGNYAEIYQDGSGHDVSLLQLGNNKHTAGGHGTGTVTRGAYVTQTGTGQTAVIEQRGRGNQITVTQSVANNYAEHKILADERTNSTYGTIDQNGTGNSAIQTFNPDFTPSIGHQYDDYFTAIQQGDGNSATQTIHTEWGHNNEESIEQYGNDNNASQLQEASGASLNTASIVQDGNENVAKQEQFGSQNDASISSTGSFNGTVADPILITQDGTGNIGTIIQTGDYNAALISQTGDAHNASITQIGNNNSASVTQSN